MYSISKIFEFDSAHFLRKYEGKCKNLHGHLYRVQITLQSNELDSIGMILDFSTLKELAKKVFVDEYDHILLNDLLDYSTKNPTAENMAETIYYKLREKICSLSTDRTITLTRIDVWETPSAMSSYWEE